MNLSKSNSYLNNYIIFFGLGFLILSIFKLIIDPQEIFQVVEIEKINIEKPLIDQTGLRKLKSIEIEQGNYDTLILGTSRAMTGVDPLSPVLQSRKSYNAGLSSANLYEINQVFKFTKKTQQLNLVIWGLDFLTFSDQNTVSGDFYLSRFADKSLFEIYLRSLFSNQQFFHSLETLKFNLEGNKARRIYTDQGLRIENTDDLNYQTAFRDQLKYDTNKYRKFNYKLSQSNLNLFKEVIETCKRENIKLYLFISPTHASDLDAIKAEGIFPSFEQWKKDLVKIVHESGNDNVVLWDFSGYNTINTEAIPTQEQKKQMKWYLDSSHYSSQVGDLILDLMLNYPYRSKNIPSDFGVLLTPENIDSHLKNIRHQQALYQQSNPNIALSTSQK